MGATRVSFAVLALLAVAAPANAAPTLGNGDCWRSGTPLTCRYNWRSGQHLYVTAVDLMSDYNSSWRTPLTSSNQALVWCGRPADRVVQHVVQHQLHLLLGHLQRVSTVGSAVAMTWNCTVTDYCSNVNQAMNIGYSDIYVNRSKFGSSTYVPLQKAIVAHETGHALGLFHSAYSTDLVYASATVSTPQPRDVGSLPPCAAGSASAGVRCVYGWNQ